MSNSIVYHEFPGERRPALTTIADSNGDDVSLGQYVAVIYKSRWLIILFSMIGILCAGLYAISAKPAFESNFLIHVEEQGDKKPNTTFTDMGAMFNVKTSATSEIELVKSRLVISRALDKLNIYVSSGPAYFPIGGRWLSAKDWRLPIPPGFGGYAWRDEKMEVGKFTVPDALLNHEFTIVAGEMGRFDLQDRTGTLSTNGKVGVPLKLNHADGQIELLITELRSPPSVRFSLQRNSKLAMIQGIQASLSAVEQGKQSGVISVVLRGSDPKWVSLILTEIAQQYTAQNAARKTQEAQNALEFLNKQLPELKQQLEESETKYNRFRNSKGTIDLPEEAKSNVQQLALAKNRKVELEQKRTELLIRFTPNHPVVSGLDAQLKDTDNEIRKLTGHIKGLPLVEQELLKLSRDVKINTELYTSLLNTARQLRLVTVSAATNVRLVDMPMVPERSISLASTRILGLGLFGGLLAGIAVAFARKLFENPVENSYEIEHALNLPVFATIPYSSMQQKLQGRRGTRVDQAPLLAKVAPRDQAVECLRNFRAVLQCALPRLKNNITLIVSPTASNGKSFISANLSTVMASGYKRVLLIDADFRNGDVHQYFGIEQSRGFAEVLAGMANIDAVIHRAVMPNVDFISSGALPGDGELLMQPSLGELLRSIAPLYDMVIVNGTPLLEVSDSLSIAAHAGTIYIVARAGVSTSGQIADTIRILRQAGFSADGCLLNGVKTRAKPSANYYRYRYGNQWSMQQAQRNLPVPDITDVTVRMRQG